MVVDNEIVCRSLCSRDVPTSLSLEWDRARLDALSLRQCQSEQAVLHLSGDFVLIDAIRGKAEAATEVADVILGVDGLKVLVL